MADIHDKQIRLVSAYQRISIPVKPSTTAVGQIHLVFADMPCGSGYGRFHAYQNSVTPAGLLAKLFQRRIINFLFRQAGNARQLR